MCSRPDLDLGFIGDGQYKCTGCGDQAGRGDSPPTNRGSSLAPWARPGMLWNAGAFLTSKFALRSRLFPWELKNTSSYAHYGRFI